MVVVEEQGRQNGGGARRDFFGFLLKMKIWKEGWVGLRWRRRKIMLFEGVGIVEGFVVVVVRGRLCH